MAAAGILQATVHDKTELMAETGFTSRLLPATLK